MTGRSRLPMIGGVVLYAYLLVWMGQLLLLYGSPEGYDRAVSWSASFAGRLVACAVLLAAVYHLLDGLRRTVSLWPAAVPFLTWALVIPGWAVLLRPWLVP